MAKDRKRRGETTGKTHRKKPGSYKRKQPGTLYERDGDPRK